MERTFETHTAFAEAIGVAKSTFSRYLRRDDFPARRSPPWGLQDLAIVQRWRAACLQEDRARLYDDPPEPAARSDFPLTVADARRAMRDLLGRKLYGELTRDDFESLIEHVKLFVTHCDGTSSEAIRDEMDRATRFWTARRFIDRLNWWRELPELPDDPPHGWLDDLTPLDHRAERAERGR